MNSKVNDRLEAHISSKRNVLADSFSITKPGVFFTIFKVTIWQKYCSKEQILFPGLPWDTFSQSQFIVYYKIVSICTMKWKGKNIVFPSPVDHSQDEIQPVGHSQMKFISKFLPHMSLQCLLPLSGLSDMITPGVRDGSLGDITRVLSWAFFFPRYNPFGSSSNTMLRSLCLSVAPLFSCEAKMRRQASASQE